MQFDTFAEKLYTIAAQQDALLMLDDTKDNAQVQIAVEQMSEKIEYNYKKL